MSTYKDARGCSPSQSGMLPEEAIRRVRGHVPSWTSEKPTVPGWYWWRRTIVRHRQSTSKVYILEFVDSHNGPYNSCWGHASMLDGHWSGPLEPPKEQP